MELEITWKRALKVWWAVFWRLILATLASTLVGAVVGGIMGFIIGTAGSAMGASYESITLMAKIVAFPVGLVIGMGFSVFAIKLLLKKKSFGDFRLVLLPVNNKEVK